MDRHGCDYCAAPLINHIGGVPCPDPDIDG